MSKRSFGNIFKKIHFLTRNLCIWLCNFWARSLLQLSCYLVWSEQCCGRSWIDFPVASQNFPEEFSSLPGTFLGTTQNSSMVIEGSGACPGHLVSMLGGWFALGWLFECWGACWSAPLSHFGRFGGEGFCYLFLIKYGSRRPRIWKSIWKSEGGSPPSALGRCHVTDTSLTRHEVQPFLKIDFHICSISRICDLWNMEFHN